MKPLLVAILAASVFIIPVSKKSNPRFAGHPHGQSITKKIVGPVRTTVLLHQAKKEKKENYILHEGLIFSAW